MTTPLLDIDGRMVDRRQEMTELRDAVDAAARVGGGCVLLSGAPGVGKSTLTQAFGVEVSQRNCVFAYGRCRDGAPAPYAALGDALSSLVRTMEATGPAERDRWRADLVSGTSTLAGVLGELVPDLAQVLGEAPHVSADLDAADARRRLHRAAIRLMSDTASYRPVVLAIDDLQWADRDTLLLLSELLTVSLRNVLVVGAHRAGEFDPDSAGFTAESLRSMELSPLSPEDVEELLADGVRPSCGAGRRGRRIPPSDRRQSSAGSAAALPRATRRRTHPGRRRRPCELGSASPHVDRGHGHGPRVPRPLPRPAAPSRPGSVEFAHVLGRRVRPRRRYRRGRRAAGRGRPGALVSPRAPPARSRRQQWPADHQHDQPRRPIPLQP